MDTLRLEGCGEEFHVEEQFARQRDTTNRMRRKIGPHEGCIQECCKDSLSRERGKLVDEAARRD